MTAPPDSVAARAPIDLPAPALALDRITCTFAARAGAKGDETGRYTAVEDPTTAIAPGEFVSVVGATGCGKSTLLNVAAGLLAPSAGSVAVFGALLDGLNRSAGYMFQTCLRRRHGCSRACTPPLAWHSSARSSASISVRQRVWAT